MVLIYTLTHLYPSISHYFSQGNGFDIRGQTSLCDVDDAHYLSTEKAFWIGFGFAKYIKQKYINKPGALYLNIFTQ